jgi:tripartite-type tricarboxylate transporter receptor subunit TctC
MLDSVTRAICALALAAPLTGFAQDYPARTVRVVVPFAPGGGTDIVARLLAQHLSQRLKQSFVVENRPAGSGIVGADLVAKAQPDGYTLLFAFSSLASSAKLVSKLPYHPVSDFAPITLATTSPLLLIVPPSVPAKDTKEFIAYAKANPGKLNYGSSGPKLAPPCNRASDVVDGREDDAHPVKGIAPAVQALLATRSSSPSFRSP